ncbi:LapA family protein [Prolixibacteraceae bacterium Z1-6]|uniref:LapA family protein n=1 Tax=Draconibacterium aestuarii TaxID=2998507 RepID=A0A9X3J7H4_9BACT|nr:LapA family protein [Prolixibacteraceae bacterium Z1-6]
MQAIIVILLILAVLLVIFTLQNAMDITINVFFWEIKDAPLVVVLITCILLGYLIASFYFYPKLWKLKREYKQMIKFNNEQKELHELTHKNAPKPRDKVNNPEGMKLDDDDDYENPFF